LVEVNVSKSFTIFVALLAELGVDGHESVQKAAFFRLLRSLLTIFSWNEGFEGIFAELMSSLAFSILQVSVRALFEKE
jgi:hypothetical protein